jgi:tetratricopeptide (TPR) repeat protein
MLRGILTWSAAVAVGLSLSGCGSKPSTKSLPFRERIEKAQQEKSPDLRTKALLGIAKDQAEAKDVAGASETLKLARQACQEVSEPTSQAGYLLSLGAVQLSIGRPLEAKGAATAALAAANKIENLEIKGPTLAEVAEFQNACDDTDGATATLKEVETLIAKLPDAADKSVVSAAAGAAYDKLGRRAQSKKLLDAAIELTKSIDDGVKRCRAIAEIAARQLAIKQNDAAEKTFALAETTCRALEEPGQRAQAMIDIAKAYSKAGDHAKAHELLAEADKVAKKVKELDLQGPLRKDIDQLMKKLPKPQE